MAASKHVELRQRIDDQVRRAIAHGQFELHDAANPLTRRKPGLMTVDFELVAESIPQIVWMAALALLMLVVPIAMAGGVAYDARWRQRRSQSCWSALEQRSRVGRSASSVISAGLRRS